MPAAALAANVAYIAAHVDQLIEAAQARRRAVNAPHLAALVRARFERGLPAECDELQAA